MIVPVIDKTYRQYPDGRQVCLDNQKGKAEYKSRTLKMASRQGWICSRGKHKIYIPTFDHSTSGRGAGGAMRDDRIEDENGNPINSCSCWTCNGRAGSVKIKLN